MSSLDHRMNSSIVRARYQNLLQSEALHSSCSSDQYELTMIMFSLHTNSNSASRCFFDSLLLHVARKDWTAGEGVVKDRWWRDSQVEHCFIKRDI